ncbi:MAG: RNA-binding domain-containing protein [Nitrososphaerales archaeon]
MTSVNFASAEIEVMIHATEDSKKVLSAIKQIFSIEPEEFVANVTRGHFGNEIVRMQANLSGERANDIAYKIATMLNDVDRVTIYDNFDLFVDKSSIYLRISKQKIFEKKIMLDQVDSLKIKLKTVRGFQTKSELENYRMLLKGRSDNN